MQIPIECSHNVVKIVSLLVELYYPILFEGSSILNREQDRGAERSGWDHWQDLKNIRLVGHDNLGCDRYRLVFAA
jgi:hypothetical protein